MKHYGDITKLNGAEMPAVDCITFGAPCQDLSIAGYRAGMKHEERGDDVTTRSGLFFEAIRIIKEMRKHEEESGRTGAEIRPRFAVYENVKGAFTSNKGKDFQAVLTEIFRIAVPEAPDVPLPDSGKWPHAGLLLDEVGGCQSLGDCMTLNFGASPSVVKESRLSQILEDSAPDKYYLSPKACKGILTRAERRNKELPPELKAALIAQSA